MYELLMAFAACPLHLLPSCSHRFYLGLVLPLQMVAEKQELHFILTAKEVRVCVSVCVRVHARGGKSTHTRELRIKDRFKGEALIQV